MKKLVIMSTFLAHRSFEHNMVNHSQALRLLQGLEIDAQTVQGCYEDLPETSILCTCTNLQDVEQVKNLAFVLYKQESVLVVHEDNQAILALSTGKCSFLGIFRKVSDCIAMQSQGYTLIDGQYYICDEDLPAWGDCCQSTIDAVSEALHDCDKPQFNNDARYDESVYIQGLSK